jgi:hypothetical protein
MNPMNTGEDKNGGSRMIRKMLVILVFVLVGVTVQSDEKTVPKLKDDVKLELTLAQNAIYKLALQQRQLEQQYRTVQEQLTSASAAFQTKLKTAMNRSGIDDTKWEINAETLELTPKPVPPPDQKPTEPAKKP